MTRLEMVAGARAILDALGCSPAEFSEAQLRGINAALDRLEPALKSVGHFSDFALTRAYVAKLHPGSPRIPTNLTPAKDAAYGLYMAVSMWADDSEP